MNMKRRDGYVDEDTMIVDGHRVKVADKMTMGGLEASYGYKKRLMTPCGSYEVCTVFSVPSLYGERERYAQVHRPSTNLGVAFSTFKLTDV